MKYRLLHIKFQSRRTSFLRKIKDALSRQRFARIKSYEKLPVMIYKHASLIRRRLGNTDLELQENKAVNLALSAPKVNGILIRPGETFSFWHLIGPDTARHGYKVGLTISNNKPSTGVGGGHCQFTNLIHWMVLHSDLTIVEHHHHDGFDLFPDYKRQIPFGTGTSIVYNYLDYRFRMIQTMYINCLYIRMENTSRANSGPVKNRNRHIISALRTNSSPKKMALFSGTEL